LDDCADLRRRVRVCGDDEQAREKIRRDAVCTDEAGVHGC
jgi:predicted dinucleotide-binding enzyme